MESMLFEKAFNRLSGGHADEAGFVPVPFGRTVKESCFFWRIVIPVRNPPPPVAPGVSFDKFIVKINLNYFAPQFDVRRLAHILVRHGIESVSHLDVAVESHFGTLPGYYFKRRHRQWPELFFFRQVKEG